MISLFFQSVFSFRSYPYFRAAGPWRTAFFAVYIWLLGTLFFNVWFALQLREKLPVFLRGVPEITFEKGKLTGPDKAVSVALPGTDFYLLFDAQAANPPSRREFTDKRILAFVAGNKLYTPSVTGVQSQILPTSFSAKITQQFLQAHRESIRTVLQGAAFFGSAAAVGLFLLFSFCLAGTVLYLWSGIKRMPLGTGTTLRWAVFLQGPALVLWLVNLLWGVPLFLFGLFIVFMIYTQQIFNVLSAEKR